eukprot:RCo034039
MASPLSPLPTLPQDLTGLLVRLKTSTGETFEGAVVGHDPDRAILVLHEPSDVPTRSNYRIFKTEVLTEIALTSDKSASSSSSSGGEGGVTPVARKLPEPLNADSRLLKCNINKVSEYADRESANRSQKLGQEVTIEAQDIFDGMARTYPCTWDHTSMIILGEVRIDFPYTTEKVHAWNPSGRGSSEERDKGLEVTVERVKKVLEGVRTKLKLGTGPAPKK